jgi:hypothetical protein
VATENQRFRATPLARQDDVDALEAAISAALDDVAADMGVFKRALQAVIEDVDSIMVALAPEEAPVVFRGDASSSPEEIATVPKPPADMVPELVDMPDENEETPEEEAARLIREAEAANEGV